MISTMAFASKLIVLAVIFSTTPTRKSKITHDKSEHRMFTQNTISTSSLAPPFMTTNKIIIDSTTSTFSSIPSAIGAIKPTPSLTSQNDFSNAPLTSHHALVWSPMSRVSPLKSTMYLKPTMSYLESPMNTESLRPEASSKPIAISTVDLMPSTSSVVSLTRKTDFSTTPPIPILKVGKKISSQRSQRSVLKPDDEVPPKPSPAPVLLQEGLSPQPSSAPVLQSTELDLTYTEWSLMVSSTTAISFEEYSTTTRRMTTVVEGENVPEYKTILTSTQKTIDIECSTGDCFEFNPRERITPNLIQNGTMVDALLGPRQFDCEFTVDIPNDICKENMIQTELFYCIHWIPSCRDNCGKVLDSCSCDINCGIYNICCDDFEDVCPDIFEDAKRSLGGLLDVKIECVGEYNSYLVIAGCPENYTSPDLILGCEDGEILINSIDGLHFKNVACLRCNGFTEVESEKWTMSIYLKYVRGIQLSLLAELDTKVMKILSSIWEVPEKVFNPTRVCSPRTIEECPAGSDGHLVEKCSTSKGNVLVKSQNTINIYKNIYCADCHTKSDYFCRGTSKYDYKTVMRVGRFSSVISLTFDQESERFELESSQPFLWRKALCTGPVNKLNCIITKCFIDIPPVNNTCGLHRTETCVWMEFSTSSEANKTDLQHFMRLMNNVSILRPDVTVLKIAYSYDFTKRNLKFRLVFTMWSGAFPYTLDDLYEHYSSFANDFLMERRLEGEFSLCFNMIREMTDCSNLKCETRNYTIQEPSNQGSVSNRGDRLLNRSHDGNKLPVDFCLFLVTVVMCVIFVPG